MNTAPNIKHGTVGSLTGIPTGFPTGQTKCRYLGRTNGLHTFRSLTTDQTVWLTDDELAAATWTA